MGRKSKHPFVDFNGIRYYFLPKTSYYKCDHKHGGERLHRAIWIFHNGPIPVGLDVHHEDEDKDNNRIENYRLLPKPAHSSLHSAQRARDNPAAARKHMLEVVIPAAAKWHGSPEGLAWHSEHGKKTWEGRKGKLLRCAHCKKRFWSLAPKRGFCSPSCQNAARRASGVDNESRACAICGTQFECNKRNKKKTCSHGCWREALSRSYRSRL